jgi:hypothetical protein
MAPGKAHFEIQAVSFLCLKALEAKEPAELT